MDSIVRAFCIYVALVTILRTVGRRSLQQATAFEWILIFLIGGVCIQEIITDDHSITNAVLTAATLALTHVAASLLQSRVPWFARIATGTPISIELGSNWDRGRLNALLLNEEDVMAMARSKGLTDRESVGHVVVERNGTINVFPAAAERDGGGR